jgi:hypothetical protein
MEKNMNFSNSWSIVMWHPWLEFRYPSAYSAFTLSTGTPFCQHTDSCFIQAPIFFHLGTMGFIGQPICRISYPLAIMDEHIGMQCNSGQGEWGRDVVKDFGQSLETQERGSIFFCPWDVGGGCDALNCCSQIATLRRQIQDEPNLRKWMLVNSVAFDVGAWSKKNHTFLLF